MDVGNNLIENNEIFIVTNDHNFIDVVIDSNKLYYICQ